MGIIVRRPKEPEARRYLRDIKAGKSVEIDPELLARQRELDKYLETHPEDTADLLVNHNYKEPKLDASILAMRVNDIWGVDLQELWPKVRALHTNPNHAATYYPNEHEMSFDSRYKDDNPIIHHEVTHGIDNLLSPKDLTRTNRIPAGISFAAGGYPREYQQQIKTEMISNLTAKRNQTKNQFANIILTFFDTTKNTKLIALASFLNILYLSNIHPITLPLSGKVAGRQIEMSLIRNRIYKIYDEHGIDGLILFMVFPPRVIGTLETYIWRRKMVRYGLLKPNCGLTDKGITFIKKILPRNEIERRIAEAEKNRQIENAKKK